MAASESTHERLQGHGPDLRAGSERGFGFVFALVFGIVGMFPMFGGGAPFWWAFAVGALFAILALVAPRVLAPFNRLWFRFGMLLASVINPLVLGAIFFLTIVPTGLLMRAFGKDPLRLARDPQADSYWLPRTPPGPPPASLERQF